MARITPAFGYAERRLADPAASTTDARGLHGNDVEQRRHPRYAERLAVELEGARLHTTNVSLGGMQVEIPAMRYAGLCAMLAARVPTWRIALPAQPLTVIVIGEFRYADHVDDVYLAGVAFLQWHAYGEERWRTYLESLASR